MKGSKSHWRPRISRNKPPMALADQTSTRGESHAPRDTTGGPQATPCRRLTHHARPMATSGRLGWGAGGACSTEGAPLPCPRPSPVRPGRRPCPGGPCPASTPPGAALRRLGQAVLVQTDGFWGSAARGPPQTNHFPADFGRDFEELCRKDLPASVPKFQRPFQSASDSSVRLPGA